MSSAVDLTGQRFGKLVAIERVVGKGWKCICDCGNTTVAQTGSLNNGSTTSCGCSKVKNLKGRRFGRLVIKSDTGRRNKSGQIIWKAICDCGKETEAVSTKLIPGHKKSCGCYNADTGKEIYEKHIAPYDYKGTSILRLNQKTRCDSSTQIKGVYWDSKRNKYEAYITLMKKKRHLGRFNKIEDAIKARKKAEEELFKPAIEEYEELTKE